MSGKKDKGWEIKAKVWGVSLPPAAPCSATGHKCRLNESRARWKKVVCQHLTDEKSVVTRATSSCAAHQQAFPPSLGLFYWQNVCLSCSTSPSLLAEPTMMLYLQPLTHHELWSKSTMSSMSTCNLILFLKKKKDGGLGIDILSFILSHSFVHNRRISLIVFILSRYYQRLEHFL